ncbi:MAG: efflux RND transporter periplasmic adaptor subunit [Lachnospiraceae bacterium]|jgi:RND family efflux transporter, MFP subunit|nr:efflux RND transporter periplasmic adaptor subunit [Lachnospiraceae bacterium]
MKIGLKKKNKGDMAEVVTKEKKVLTPAEKKKRKKKIILGVVAVCLVLFIASRMMAPEVLPPVMVQTPQIATIEQTVDTSGTIRTEQKKTYFSPLSAKVSECRVSLGDAVSAGDVLIVYDSEDLKNRESEAKLQNDEAYYTYQDTVGKSNEDAAEFSRSSHDIEILEQQVEDWKAEVKALKQYLTDMGCHLRDATSEGRTTQAEEYQNRIDQATNTLAVKEEELAQFESDLAEQKGIKNSTEDSMLTANGRKQAEATKELAAIKAEKITAAVAQVADGLKADFGGVVTDVKAVEGSVIEESGELLTIESNEDVCVEISLSKSDLEKVHEGQKAVITVVGKEYEGTVTRISKTAVKNEKGASVVSGEIHIDNPDEDLFLGVDAKVKIQGTVAEDAIAVPIESVNVGRDGSFVYIVENGMLAVRNVETGISSMDVVEIKSGLDGTEQVVLNNSMGLPEGTPVTAVEG